MKLIVGLLSIWLFLGCSDGNTDGAPSCVEVFCTEEYRAITISIKDKGGNAVALDDFKVIVLSNGNDITLDVSSGEYDWMVKNGTYPLFSDKYAAKYRNKKLKINFKGYVDNGLIVDSDYTVGADCCHVLLIEGETAIVLANP